MKEVKNEKLEKLIEDIKNSNISNEEIQKLFEGYQLYMSKDEFANLVIDLFLETTNENMKTILMSRKGKLYNDYQDEYGDGFINLMIVKAVRETDKRNAMKKLFELLSDDEIEFCWHKINGNHENSLHVVCLISNYLTKDEIITFLEIFKKHNFNPLNIDDMHRNAFNLFLMDNKHPKKHIDEIVKIMEEMVTEFTIEVDNYIEEENEVEVTVTTEG